METGLIVSPFPFFWQQAGMMVYNCVAVLLLIVSFLERIRAFWTMRSTNLLTYLLTYLFSFRLYNSEFEPQL